MYIKSVRIETIRSIFEYKMEFTHNRFPGWHVVIGDNGSGKSTLVRAIALGLIGPSEFQALREDWNQWLSFDTEFGKIVLYVSNDTQYDKRSKKGKSVENFYIPISLRLEKEKNHNGFITTLHSIPGEKHKPEEYLWGSGKGWFSASFGPFRRFSGGNKDWEKLFYTHPKLAPHLSSFGEEVALSECLEWLKQVYIQNLDGKLDYNFLPYLVNFINKGELLPHKTIILSIDSTDIYFQDGNNSQIAVNQLSDGYRSILSMTFELIRLLIRTYGAEEVFQNIEQGDDMTIPLPGVVLIDEIDAHLHPSWQVKIGSWFCKYFPKIQFIVTTHSPLICHAKAENVTVWRLPTPGSDQKYGKVEGVELKRLLYGNILEAFDTQLFGEDVTRSLQAKEKLQRIAELNVKSIQGKLSPKEKRELQVLRNMFPTSLNKTE